MAIPEHLISEDEDDDAEEEPVTPPKVNLTRHRGSISAEAFGVWNKREAFTPPVYPKTPEQTAELTSVLSRSFLFHTLDMKCMQVVLLAMKGPLVLEAGHRLIQEGHSGEHLYVVTEGSFDCIKVINGAEMVVKVCVKGDLFGELALLYNCPRAASVQSREASVVWELDRGTFNNIVMEAVQRKRDQCSEVLRKVAIFANMPRTELERIIDVLKEETYPQGTVIIRQGDLGEHFYVIHEGEVMASKQTPDHPEPTTFVHKAGDYFGELALLRDAPRAASVVATSPEVRLLSMDRASFRRLMGPAEEFLQLHAARYG